MATTVYTTNVIMFKGVPFDSSYTHILSPAGVDVKLEKLKALYDYSTFNNLQFIKLNTATGSGVMRLNVNVKIAQQFNYAYINDGKNAPYFCFVHGCQYINDGPQDTNPLIRFAMYEYVITKDVFMSHFISNDQLMAAPVIRHTSTERFKNPKGGENFPATDLYNYSYVNAISSSAQYTVVMYIDSENYLGVDLCNVPCGCHVKIYTETTNAFVDLKEKLESDNARIIGIFKIPVDMYDGPYPAIDGVEVTDQMFVKSATVQPGISYNSTQGNIDLPAVVNNKCYYYPYNMLRVYANDGTYYDCAFEDFDGVLIPQFTREDNPLPPVYFTVKPKDYRNSANNPLGFKIKTTSYPMGSYSEDAYSTYLANRYDDSSNEFKILGQLFAEQIPQIGTGIVGTASGLDPMGVVHAGESFMGNMWGEWNAMQSASRQTDSFGGSVTAGGSDNVNNNINITFSHVAIHPKRFGPLDDYFTRYGYAQDGVIDVPDVAGRDKYVYVRMGDVCFKPKGGVDVIGETGNTAPNQNETRIINNILMAGTTIWKTSAFDGTFSYAFNGADPVPLPHQLNGGE